MTEFTGGKAILLGIGRLTWDPGERRSNRYGSVHLMATGDSLNPATPAETIVPAEIIGQQVALWAVILVTRESTHIGDLFRGIFPSTPNVGDKFKLGVGCLFTEKGDYLNVGLSPHDGRDSDWLDPHVLYCCHEQSVELIAVVAA